MRAKAAFPIIILLASCLAIGQTTQSAPDASTPKGALKCLAIAMDQGQADQIRNLLAANNPLEAKIAGGMCDMAISVFNMNKALEDRFGKEEAQRITDSADQLKQSLANIDLAGEKVDGDTATVSIAPTRQGTMSLKKTNGTWKISVEQQARGLAPQQVDATLALLAAQIRAMQEVTSEIQAGKYATADEATAALRTKVGAPATMPASQPAAK